MLAPWGLSCFVILALSLSISSALPTVGNRRSAGTTSEDTPANRNFGGINVPNPSIPAGIPIIKEARAYLTGRFRKKQPRTPEDANLHPLPPAPTDAVQPQKVPVPDSAVESIKSASQPQNPNPTDEPYVEVAADDLNHGGSASDSVNALGYDSDSDPEKLDDIIQSLATASSTSPSSIPYGKVDDLTTSEDRDPNSLSHSLGTISHTRFEVEDRGKKRRDQQESQALEAYRKRQLNTTEDIAPTIWNSNISVDDLDFWETKDLDKLLELEDFIRNHRGQPLPSTLSSTAPPPASLPTAPPSLAPSATNSNVTKPHNSTESNSFAPGPSSSSALVPSSSETSPVASPQPKSIAHSYNLISHRLFKDKKYHGHKRNAIQDANSNNDRARAQKAPASGRPPLVLSDQNDIHRARRDGGNDFESLGTLDISDEAYDEFRKKYPKYFGGGWKKERSMSTITGRRQSLEARHPVSPSWLAMLFSPSAFLEKRPIGASGRVEKRESSQSAPENESQWFPDEVPVSSEMLPSNPNNKVSTSSESSDAHLIEKREALSQNKNGIANKDMKEGFLHRREKWLKDYVKDYRQDGKRQTHVLPPARRDGMYKYATTVARDDLEPAKGSPHSDEWFESAFTEAWEEEHDNRMT